MGSYVGFRASPPRGLVGIPARSGSRTPCPHISLSHAETGSGPRKGTSPGLPADGGAWRLTTWWPWHPGGGWCSELGSTGPGSGGGEGPHKDPAHCSFQRSQGTLGTVPKTCSLSASPVTLQEFQGSASLWPVLTASPAGKGTHRVLPSLANIAKLSREGGQDSRGQGEDRHQLAQSTGTPGASRCSLAHSRHALSAVSRGGGDRPGLELPVTRRSPTSRGHSTVGSPGVRKFSVSRAGICLWVTPSCLGPASGCSKSVLLKGKDTKMLWFST